MEGVFDCQLSFLHPPFDISRPTKFEMMASSAASACVHEARRQACESNRTISWQSALPSRWPSIEKVTFATNRSCAWPPATGVSFLDLSIYFCRAQEWWCVMARCVLRAASVSQTDGSACLPFPTQPLFRLKIFSTWWIVSLSSYLTNIVQS
jgi:hypothetical protein